MGENDNLAAAVGVAAVGLLADLVVSRQTEAAVLYEAITLAAEYRPAPWIRIDFGAPCFQRVRSIVARRWPSVDHFAASLDEARELERRAPPARLRSLARLLFEPGALSLCVATVETARSTRLSPVHTLALVAATLGLLGEEDRSWLSQAEGAGLTGAAMLRAEWAETLLDDPTVQESGGGPLSASSRQRQCPICDTSHLGLKERCPSCGSLYRSAPERA